MIGIGIANSIGLNSAAAAPDPAASAYFTATGITGATEQTAIDNLVKGLKQDGLWSKMKAVYPFVTDNRNLLGYTEAFDNAAWSKGGGTSVTANSTTAPDGTATADTIVLPNTGTIAQSLTSSTSQTFTFSIYLRASSNTTIKIGFVSPSIVTTCNVTTSWQRFTITHTFTGVTYPQLYNDTGSSVTLFAWGAQAELGSTATTYQPIATTQQAFISNQFKYNLVNPVDSDAAFRLVFNGGWIHSANGATPNGTNGYADTKLVPSSVFSNANNSGASIYQTNPPTAFSHGCFDSNSRMFAQLDMTEFDARMNTTAAVVYKIPYVNNGIGMVTISRNTSDNVRAFKNGSFINQVTVDSQLVGVSSFVGARNANGIASAYDNTIQKFLAYHNGLTDTEAANLYTAVQAFQNSLNRAVI